MSNVSHCSNAVNHSTITSGRISKSDDLQEALARLTNASTVANCLDTLKMSFWVNWLDSKVLHQLEEAKQRAQDSDLDSEPIDLSGHTFNCSRSGTKLFKYRLVKGDVRFLFSPRKHDNNIPNTRLEVGSMSCWCRPAVYSD